MRKNIVVSYTIRPEAQAEHVRLIEGVFRQLQAEKPADVDYQVMCLEDGVSFVHVSSHDTEDGENPLPRLAAFREFGQDIGSRVATAPKPAPATAIGVYHGLTDPS
jgi:hypothetical protein